MASKDYLKLCQEAQRKKLKLAKAQEKQIKQIYNDMYLNVSKKLKKVNPNTLSERYLEELQKELAKEIKNVHNKVGKIIKKNIKESSELANNVQLDFFISINDKYNLNMKDTFSSMFSKIPKAAMDEILFEEIRTIHRQVGKIIKKNIEKSSELANNVQLDFFMSINSQYNLNMKDTFSSMFSKIPKAAMDEILFGKAYKDRKGLSERIWQYTKKFDKDIDYIISEGIANKKSTYEIAKDLEKYVNPNAAKDFEWNKVYEIAKDLEKYVNPNAAKDFEWNKVYPNSSKKLDYNAQRLARTAINHAYQQAQKRSCSKNPYVTGIRWISADIHERTCQQCKDRHNTVYKVEDVPLDHANGLCTTVPEIPMSLEDIGMELRSWVDGASIPKLDKWFGKHGEDFI